jgi:glycosyltransferase involved in cell wall biosynthesis
VVAYLGSLSQPSHPVDLLVKAFQQVLERIPEAVLLLVGGGEDVKPLEALARQLGIDKAVRFGGRVPAEQVPGYYALAELTVDPVHDDDAARGRSPLKMFESWIMEVPFVTSPVGERLRLAGDPPACRMAIPAGDPQALAKAILEVMSSTELADTLIQRGVQRVEDYTWDRLARRLEAVYQASLRGNHAGKH